MNKILRLTVPLLAAIFVLMVGLFLVEASAASFQPDMGVEGGLARHHAGSCRDFWAAERSGCQTVYAGAAAVEVFLAAAH
jgi:hypothetical protein